MNKIDDLFKYNQIISNEIERKIIIALLALLLGGSAVIALVLVLMQL